jgi:type IV pilus assembly protein PilM
MVDLTSFAVLRSLVTMDQTGLDSLQAEALVDVGANITNIVVHQGGVPRFVRILLMGGGDITDALAERLGVPAEQAEAVKQESGLAAMPGVAEATPAGRAIEATASAFVEEVRGSLDFYMAQSGAVRIGRVVLSGGGSRLNGLAERLSSATRLPVQAARPMSTLKLGKTGLTPDQLAYVEPMVAVPVGLAMGVSS